MPGNIGPMEIILVLVIALLVLGPKKLPEVGRSVGKGLREFKDGVAGITGDKDDDPTVTTAVPSPPMLRADSGTSTPVPAAVAAEPAVNATAPVAEPEPEPAVTAAAATSESQQS